MIGGPKYGLIGHWREAETGLRKTLILNYLELISKRIANISELKGLGKALCFGKIDRS